MVAMDQRFVKKEKNLGEFVCNLSELFVFSGDGPLSSSLRFQESLDIWQFW